MLRCDFCENRVEPCSCGTDCPLYTHIPQSTACSAADSGGYIDRKQVIGFNDEDLPLELI